MTPEHAVEQAWAVMLVLVLLLTLAFAGCAPGRPPSDPGPTGADVVVPPAPTPTPLGRLTIKGEVLDGETERPLPDAVVTINGRLAGRGSFSFEAVVNEEIVMKAEAVGYLPWELVIRPHLDPGRDRTLTAPIRLKPVAWQHPPD